MPRPQPSSQQQALADAGKGAGGEEEVANGGGEVDEAMEEDVEQEGYGKRLFTRATILVQLSWPSRLTKHALLRCSIFHPNIIINMDKLVLRPTRS